MSKNCDGVKAVIRGRRRKNCYQGMGMKRADTEGWRSGRRRRRGEEASRNGEEVKEAERQGRKEERRNRVGSSEQDKP